MLTGIAMYETIHSNEYSRTRGRVLQGVDPIPIHVGDSDSYGDCSLWDTRVPRLVQCLLERVAAPSANLDESPFIAGVVNWRAQLDTHQAPGRDRRPTSGTSRSIAERRNGRGARWRVGGSSA